MMIEHGHDDQHDWLENVNTFQATMTKLSFWA